MTELESLYTPRNVPQEKVYKPDTVVDLADGFSDSMMNRLFGPPPESSIRKKPLTREYKMEHISKIVRLLTSEETIHYRCRTTERLPSEIFLEKMSSSDINQVSDLYKTVSIGPENISQKIDKDSSGSWKRTGGMFHPLSPEELRQMLSDKSFSMLVAKDKEQRVIGFSSATPANIAFKDVTFYQDNRSVDIYKKAEEEGRMATGLDILVHPRFMGKAFPGIMEYEHLKKLNEAGFEYGRFEIYHIVKAEGQDGTCKELDLPNQQSESFHKNAGATCVGYRPKTIVVQPYTIHVKSKIFMISIPFTMSVLQQRIKDYIS